MSVKTNVIQDIIERTLPHAYEYYLHCDTNQFNLITEQFNKKVKKFFANSQSQFFLGAKPNSNFS